MKGIGVSPGIAMGKVCILEKKEITLTGAIIGAADADGEIGKLDDALKAAVQEIEGLKSRRDNALNEDESAILDAHIELLRDPILYDGIAKKIKNELNNCQDAVIKVIESTRQIFLNMDDEYFRSRAADIRDIGDRLLKQLVKSSSVNISKLDENVIVVAHDLTPSDTIAMDRQHVIGFVTELGSKTSHAAIIAKIREIPAVVGCSALGSVKNGQMLIIDGSTGEVILNPDNKTLSEYKARQEDFMKKCTRLKLLKDLPAETADGHRVTLAGNISEPGEIDRIVQCGGKGVGLLRTEFLYMDRDCFPGEEAQFEFYKAAALKAGTNPVIIRTLDIGGDKNLGYFNLPAEANPFLGYRAIRICLDRKDIFITQLKAILRAGVFGKLKIMFPMISGIQELREAKKVLEAAKAGLEKDNTEFDRNIEAGIMIEIPSAAVTADILAKEADFFSIGTNDLCQYTLAVDRMNEKITGLYDHFHPGVLRLIENVIIQAHKNGKHVGMCGEMASDPLAALLLLGMGLDEFSMSAPSIPYIKDVIIRNSMQKAREVYSRVMEMESSTQIIEYLQVVSK